MVDVLGYDIGGANTKAALVRIKNGNLLKTDVAVEYFPIWKYPEKLTAILLVLKEQLDIEKLDAVGVTMTAELSDVYQTKREGVHHILDCVRTAFPEVPIHVLNTDGKLELWDDAKQQPLGVAAANWAATGWLVSQYLRDCVVVDVGSTSTSIIPILNGKVIALGKTDLDKLICGELVYTGSLRTNVVAIVQSIPTRNGVAGVSSELFALSADVHLALGNIAEKDYTSETTDGRGKSLSEALARLAMVVCADVEMLSSQEIINIAKYIADKQIQQIEYGLKKVYAYTKSLTSTKIPVVVTGIGKNFLARKAAMNINVDTIIDSGTLLTQKAVLATPAFGVAVMMANMIEGMIAK